MVLTDVYGKALSVDDSSLALVGMPREHHEVHSGNHYTASDLKTGISTQDYLFVAPAAKYVHLLIQMAASSGVISLAVYRGAVATASATKIAAINSNHNSANTSGVDISDTPTGITAGTDIVYRDLTGAAPNGGGMSRGDAEMVLHPGVKYLFRFTGTSTPDLLAKWIWYEVAWQE